MESDFCFVFMDCEFLRYNDLILKKNHQSYINKYVIFFQNG